MVRVRSSGLVIVALLTFAISLCQGQEWQQESNQMVKEQIKGRGIEDKRLLKVMRNTPRHRFVPQQYRRWAFSDRPLPIGHDQTISQPYIVALMTDLLKLDGDERVLEIGTGSGYQAAILGAMAKEVYTIEIIEELADKAKKRLEKMAYNNVYVKQGDGYQGWPEHAPFDRIVVTAAPETIPKALKTQLKKGGKMVLPVGNRYQELKVVNKTKTGEFSEEEVANVRFVPMVHPEGH